VSVDTEPRPLIELINDDDRERAAIETLIADVEGGLNANDADVSCRDFTAHARTITAAGSRVEGWAALLDAHRVGFAGPLGPVTPCGAGCSRTWCADVGQAVVRTPRDARTHWSPSS